MQPRGEGAAGPGQKALCKKLGVSPVLSYCTCTDTGRIADLIGAVSGALGGVPVLDLPLVAAAQECMEQKATIDAIFAQATGIYTYVNHVFNVTGGPDLVKLLTQDLSGIIGGLLNVEKDAG